MGFFSEKKRKMNRKLGVMVLAMVLMCGAIFGGVVYADAADDAAAKAKTKPDCDDIGAIWFKGKCRARLSEDQKKLKDKIDKCTKAGKTWYEDKCMEKEDARKAIEEKNAGSGGSSSEDCPDGVKTAMFGCVKDDGKGEPVFKLLGMVINIMTFGIGSLAVFGIVFSGFQYASARDNEAQVKKAKERITNIVIGLVVYAVAYAVISWLLPGGL